MKISTVITMNFSYEHYSCPTVGHQQSSGTNTGKYF